MVKVENGAEAIKAFTELALKGKNFQMLISDPSCNDGYLYDFLVLPVGTGSYIYCIPYWQREQDGNLCKRPETIAVAANGKVYIMNEYMFAKDIRTHLCEEAEADVERRIHEAAGKFYDSLEVPPDTLVDKDGARKRARINILKGVDNTPSPFPPILRPDNDLWAKDLCGLANVEREYQAVFEDQRKKWVEAKAYRQAYDRFVHSPDTVQDWEVRLAEALRAAMAKGAKNVLVTFTIKDADGERTASGNISVEAMMDSLTGEQAFAEWEFQTTAIGKQVFAALNAKTLRCRDISRVTYARKELYTRN